MGRHRVSSPPEIIVNVIIEAAWPKEVKTLAPGEVRVEAAAADPSGQMHSAPYVEQYGKLCVVQVIMSEPILVLACCLYILSQIRVLEGA